MAMDRDRERGKPPGPAPPAPSPPKEESCKIEVHYARSRRGSDASEISARSFRALRKRVSGLWERFARVEGRVDGVERRSLGLESRAADRGRAMERGWEMDRGWERRDFDRGVDRREFDTSSWVRRRYW